MVTTTIIGNFRGFDLKKIDFGQGDADIQANVNGIGLVILPHGDGFKAVAHKLGCSYDEIVGYAATEFNAFRKGVQAVR